MVIFAQGGSPARGWMFGRVDVPAFHGQCRLCCGCFLSLNQEGGFELFGHRHSRLADLCDGVLEIRWRSPHWMRRGYVEEIYAVP